MTGRAASAFGEPLRPWRRFGRVAALAGIAHLAPSLAGAAWASDITPSQDLRLEIPYNAVTYDVLPFWLGIEGGWFHRYGLDVVSAGAMESPLIVAAMLSGETPFSIAGPDAAVSADLNGGDIEVLAAGPRVNFVLYAAPAFHRVADLKDRKVGVTQFGTTTDFITRYILKTSGLDPARDVVLLPMGNAVNMEKALLGGMIDAAEISGLLDPKPLAPFNKIADIKGFDLFFYSASLLAKKSWVAAHPNDTLNTVRGYVAGIAAIYNDKQAALAALSKYTKVSDPAVLAHDYQSLVQVLQKVPVPKASVLQTNLDASKLPAARTASAASFIDASFVSELQHDGFIDSLYRPRE